LLRWPEKRGRRRWFLRAEKLKGVGTYPRRLSVVLQPQRTKSREGIGEKVLLYRVRTIN
jgi:hypothetical protein